MCLSFWGPSRYIMMFFFFFYGAPLVGYVKNTMIGSRTSLVAPKRHLLSASVHPVDISDTTSSNHSVPSENIMARHFACCGPFKRAEDRGVFIHPWVQKEDLQCLARSRLMCRFAHLHSFPGCRDDEC